MIMITKETKETSSSELSPPLLSNITGTHISTTTTLNAQCPTSTIKPQLANCSLPLLLLSPELLLLLKLELLSVLLVFQELEPL